MGTQSTDLGVQPGGVAVRTSNATIAWISISVTVGVSILIAMSVLVFLAIAYSIKKERRLRKKEGTGESGTRPVSVFQPHALVIELTV